MRPQQKHLWESMALQHKKRHHWIGGDATLRPSRLSAKGPGLEAAERSVDSDAEQRLVGGGMPRMVPNSGRLATRCHREGKKTRLHGTETKDKS